MPAGTSFSLSQAKRDFTLSIPVPSGQVPVRFEARLNTLAAAEGEILFSVDGTGRLTRPANQSGKISVPLSAEDVTKGVVAITLDWPRMPSDVACAPDNSPAITVENPFIVLAGVATEPADVASFLGPAVTSVALVSSTSPTEAESQAILSAAGAIAFRYRGAANVTLTSSPPALDPTGSVRAIQFKIDNAAEGSVTTIERVPGQAPLMTITGSPDAAQAAAQALGSPLIGLAGGREVKNLRGETLAAKPLQEVPLSALGQSTVRLVGAGEIRQDIAVPQSRFGAPISGLTMKIKGRHTPVAEGSVNSLNILWNDTLIASKPFGASDTIEFDAAVNRELVRRDNTLSFVMQATPRKGGGSAVGCSPDELPTTLDIDAAASTVKPVSGQSLAATFDRFPQTLVGTANVAIDTGAPAFASTASGIHLIRSLQLLSPQQLRVKTLPTAQLITSRESGIILGATSSTVAALKGAMPFEPFRTVDTTNYTYSGQVDSSFAALQVIAEGNRDIMVLGTYKAPTDGSGAYTLANRLAKEADTPPNGLGNMQGSIVVAQKGVPSISIDASTISSQSGPAPEAQSQGIPSWSIPLGIAVFGGLIVWQIVAYRRRIARNAAEELAAMSEEHEKVALGGQHTRSTEDGPVAEPPVAGPPSTEDSP